MKETKIKSLLESNELTLDDIMHGKTKPKKFNMSKYYDIIIDKNNLIIKYKKEIEKLKSELKVCKEEYNTVMTQRNNKGKIIKRAQDHTEEVLIKLKPYTGTKFTAEIIKYGEILGGN